MTTDVTDRLATLGDTLRTATEPITPEEARLRSMGAALSIDARPVPGPPAVISLTARTRVRPTGRWLAWAAAVAVIAGGAGLIAQRRDAGPLDDAASPTTLGTVAEASIPQTSTVGGVLEGDAPAWPPLFPALDPSDPDNAKVRMVYGQVGFGNPQRTTTVIGRQDGAAIADLVSISAVDSDAFATAMAHVYLPPTTETIDGATITIYRLSNPAAGEVTAIIEHPDGPDIAIITADPLGLIRTAGISFATASTDANGLITLDMPQLPSGYVTVIDPHIQVGGQSFPGMQWGDIGPDQATAIFVYLGNPQLPMDRSLQGVLIDGRRGWFDATGNTAYWQIEPGVWASAITSGGLDAVLDLATRVRFVDAATWRSRYPDTNQFFSNPPTSTSPDAAAASTPDNSIATNSDYCAQVQDLSGERPETYVGSDEQLGDIDRLVSAAPAAVTDWLETYRAFLASGAVDPSKPDTQLADSWPTDVRQAVANLGDYDAENC